MPRAMASPMPFDAPVTSATFPSSRRFIVRTLSSRDQDRRMETQPDRWVSVNGVRLAVDDRQHGGDATPLVLVHGFTGGRVDFADVIDALAADRRVVARGPPGPAPLTETRGARRPHFRPP